MATYVNDLRLKEIGTGESSGTWGTETNTNLELIGEALGFGTEAITTNADTHTTTVADGSTDPGRAMYLKYTGTLDSACTITIAPNTISRMHFIENATSGSQNIIISQGSGANVTIPAGDVKAVYLDGAGSGAAVTDAFASLNVVDLKVEDDLTVTDDTTIGGTLGVTGVVTANAGVVVDNITIDGTEIDLSSGDLTLDVAGDIILDAAGDQIRFKDAGTEVGHVNMDSSNLTIRSTVSDKDIIFTGNDGGVSVTALTLDMSEAGAATFNSTVTANAGVVVDDITIDGTEIDLSSGDLTIDVAGDIVLDAAGQQIFFTSGGTNVGQIDMAGTDLEIKSLVSDADFFIRGNDGGSEITALTLDMSAAGAATFNNNVTCNQLLTTDGVTDTGQAGSATVFNESGSTADFRVESTSNTHMLFVDGGLDRVGIGNSPSSVLHVIGGSATIPTLSSSFPFTISNNGNSGMTIISSGTTNAGQINFGDEGDADAGIIRYDHNDNSMRFTTNASEKMRITSDGHFLIGTTTNQGVGGISFQETATGVNIQQNMDGTSGGAEFYVFRRNSTQIGSINQNGTTGVTYNTSSDARLKDVTGASRGLDVINNLNPVAYNWKADNHADEGLIAQEVEELVPNAVSQNEDGYYQMDYSKLVTHLVKGMQEQQEQIESLKSEIANLKEK